MCCSSLVSVGGLCFGRVGCLFFVFVNVMCMV